MATAKSNTLDEKPDDNFNLIWKAFMIQKVSTDQGNWYLDFCTSRYICNKKDSAFKPCLKCFKFVTANEDIIRSKKVDTT